MPTTTNNGWPTPADTDLVKNGADAIRDLGNAIDTTLGVYSPATPGLVKINTTSFSGVTSVSLPADTFTSTYMNYRINFNLDSCTGGMTLTARMRVAGADNTQARYQQMSTGANSGGSDVNVGQLNQTSWSLGVWTNLAQNLIVDVVRPKQVSETSVMGQFAIDNFTAFVSRNLGLKQNESIAFDSMSFIASTGNIAGSINVYGYAQ